MGTALRAVRDCRPKPRWHACESGRPADWVLETHRIASEAVHLFPANHEINERYVEKALPVIQEQLAKPAVRLAWVLNRALGQN